MLIKLQSLIPTYPIVLETFAPRMEPGVLARIEQEKQRIEDDRLNAMVKNAVKQGNRQKAYEYMSILSETGFRLPDEARDHVSSGDTGGDEYAVYLEAQNVIDVLGPGKPITQVLQRWDDIVMETRGE